METTLLGIEVTYDGKLFSFFKLNDNKRSFELKNESCSLQKFPTDFVFDKFEEKEVDVLLSFRNLYEESTKNSAENAQLEIKMKRDSAYENILERLTNFGFNLPNREIFKTKTRNSNSNVKENESTLSNQTFTSDSIKLKDGKSDEIANFEFCLSNKKTTPRENCERASLTYFSTLSGNSSEKQLSVKQMNFHKNLITEISHEFDVRMPENKGEFKFPILPEFSQTINIEFVFKKEIARFEICKSDKILLLSDKCTNFNLKSKIKDFEKLEKEIYAREELENSTLAKVWLTNFDIFEISEALSNRVGKSIVQNYQPETIERHYNEKVRPLLFQNSWRSNNQKKFRKEIQVEGFSITQELRRCCIVLFENKLNIKILELFLEPLIKTFDKMIIGLSDLVIHYFSFANRYFKLSKFTAFLMKIISEEIADMIEAYFEIFSTLLLPNQRNRQTSEQNKFLKELWIILNMNVFETFEEQSDFIEKPLENLIEEVVRSKFKRLMIVNRIFQNFHNEF